MSMIEVDERGRENNLSALLEEHRAMNADHNRVRCDVEEMYRRVNILTGLLEAVAAAVAVAVAEMRNPTDEPFVLRAERPSLALDDLAG